MRLHRSHQDAKKPSTLLLACQVAAALTICSTYLLHSVGCELISSSLEATMPIPMSTPMSPAPWTIFYNVYIAPKSSASVLAMVKEQVGHIRSSAVISSRPKDTSVTLYYITIGRNDVVTESFMNSICGTDGVLQCIHLKHVSSGYEEATLKEVHSYCQRADTNTSVIYLHNKGSLNNRCGTQSRWRQRMTEAISTKECLTSIHSDSPSTSCDVCGLMFQAVPSSFFAGNFWTARCDYVKKLLEPTQYAEELKNVGTSIREQVSNNTLTATLYSLSHEWALGDGRFAMELWVGSHPDIQPCDVSATPSLTYWLTDKEAKSSDFEWALAPRKALRDIYEPTVPEFEDKSAIPTKGKTDIYLLPGQLQKWSMIYGKHPDPDSSWVYSHFPEGDYWRAQVLGQAL